MNKMIGFICLGLIVFGLCFGFSKIFTGSYEDKALKYEQEYYNMKTQYDSLSDTADVEADSASGQAVSLDLDRIARDDKLVSDFFDGCVFGWTGYDGYIEYRKSLSRKYGIEVESNSVDTEGSNFINTFMPLPKVKVKDDKVVWNEFDAKKIKYALKSISSSVIKTDTAGHFTYLTEVTYTITNKNGKSKEKGAVAVYTVDESGKISNIYGYVNVK